jgi:hypothetical protein
VVVDVDTAAPFRNVSLCECDETAATACGKTMASSQYHRPIVQMPRHVTIGVVESAVGDVLVS